MRFLPTLICLCLLCAPASAWGGGYTVTACFGAENASWTEWEPTGGADAYTSCPGGVVDVARRSADEGLMVRNVVAPRGHAVRGTTAALRFDAPAGTVIAGLDFDAKLLSNPGWSAGVFDLTVGRWLWCGAGCLTTVDQWLHQELRGLASGHVAAMVRCDAARCRRDARHGFVALRNVRVHLADDSAPSLGGVRGGLAGDGWLRGVQAVAFDASDNSGIALGRVDVAGALVYDDARACDFTRPVPCGNGPTSGSFDTRTWADGVHPLRLGARDAAGNWAWVARTVRVDNTAPPEPAPVLDGGDAWSPERTRSLSFPLPPGQVAPLVRARVRVCKAGGACRDVAPELRAAAARVSASVEAFAGPGEYTLRAALEDAAGNVGPASPPVTLRFDDTVPGAPDLSPADRWLSRGPLPLAAEAPKPLSGIRGYRVRIGGRDAIVATELPLDTLPEGGTPVEVRAISGAGVASTAVRTQLKLDRTQPVVAADSVPGPDAWSRTPVRIDLRARDQAGLSGVASVGWSIDGADEVTEPGDEATVEVKTDGRHTVAFRALDAAGNASEHHSVPVKVDQTPPETVAFEAPDPADPALVRVVVADGTSGIARGRVELRRAGGAWHALPTSLDGGRLLARIDDAALRAGPYELRAVVADVAGNETTGGSRADGTPAAVTLPLRKRTVLTARRSGRTLRARLTLDGRPLVDRPLTLTRRLRGRTAWRAVCARPPVALAAAAQASGAACALRTDAAGRVAIRLRRGPSRTLRLAFAGDAQLLPARVSAAVRSPARIRLRARPRTVAAGATVRFAGRLLGGHVPRGGKLVELQARVAAGWRTFATFRTDRRGRYGHAHRFSSMSGGRTFWVRLRVRTEPGYPFERATSPALPVRVT